MRQAGMPEETECEKLARAIAQIILARWVERTSGYERTGFQIVIHVQPGQTQARIQWPSPQDVVNFK